MSPYRNSFISHISAIEWSKLNVLIKACCNGTIELIDCEPWGKSKSLRVYRQIELKHNDYITDLKLSCNELYLLISTAKGTIYIGYLNQHDALLSLKEIQMIFKSSLSNILVIKIMISKKKNKTKIYIIFRVLLGIHGQKVSWPSGKPTTELQFLTLNLQKY